MKTTFSENMDFLCEGIMKAIELAEPRGWHTWDSFGGRMTYHEQSIREAQKESVNRFLTAVFSKEKQEMDHTNDNLESE